MDPACEEAFNHFKEILATPPVLGKPEVGEPLYLYLAITEEALAAALVREEGKAQQPIYFVSKALQGAELRYSKLEKLELALLTSSRRLRQYFQGHQVVVRTDQGIRQVLQKPDLARKMMTWAIKLSQYDLRYEPRHAIKAQVMADFLVEVTGDPTEEAGTRLILAREVGATRLEVCSDSQVITSQVNGSYQARDSLLQKYLEKVKELAKQFEEVTVQHVPRERNTRADLLSKLASAKPGVGNRSLIQGMIKEPAVALHLTKIGPSWMDLITDFLENGKLPEDEKEAKALRREAARYVIIQGQLFKTGLSQPLLKCLYPDQTDYVLREVHEGCCGHHIGGKALARKLIRAGYYWPSMIADSKDQLPKVHVEAGDNSIRHSGSRHLRQRDTVHRQEIRGILHRPGHKAEILLSRAPQTNGQVEATNKVILLGLKKRLDSKKGAWADELASVLWSYRTTEQSSTGETHFRLTYGVDAMIPVEIGESNPRLLLKGVEEAVENDLADEASEMAHLSKIALKQRMALCYNTKVLKKEFEQNDLVLRHNDIGLPTQGEGKLTANWKGPYRVKEVIVKGAYKLEKLDGKEVPRTWNAGNLRRFYSYFKHASQTI
ncbi:uncharacterized protein [Arachis hypogaea]|uniref:uncharacterized protein n=1 Tax=Arachis hypogaea TaxID=3818 RepID=UPI000DEDAC1C|nr:uncharacterized protein LOC112785508 [Arachis hypogaea]